MYRSEVFLLVTFACLQAIPLISADYGNPIHGVFIPTNLTVANNYGRYPQQQPQQQYLPYNNNIRSQAPATNYGWVVPAVNNSNVTTSNSNHDWVIGTRAHGDTLLLKTLVTKPVGFFRSMAEKTIVFPDPLSKQRISRITSIVVSDNSKKGTGGHTQIVRGGVGKPEAELRFKSNNGKKIDLSLNIYGFE